MAMASFRLPDGDTPLPWLMLDIRGRCSSVLLGSCSLRLDAPGAQCPRRSRIGSARQPGRCPDGHGVVSSSRRGHCAPVAHVGHWGLGLLGVFSLRLDAAGAQCPRRSRIGSARQPGRCPDGHGVVSSSRRGHCAPVAHVGHWGLGLLGVFSLRLDAPGAQCPRRSRIGSARQPGRCPDGHGVVSSSRRGHCAPVAHVCGHRWRRFGGGHSAPVATIGDQ